MRLFVHAVELPVRFPEYSSISKLQIHRQTPLPSLPQWQACSVQHTGLFEYVSMRELCFLFIEPIVSARTYALAPL
jgi:hypothetical protein